MCPAPEELSPLGMISHKKSLITIFGHKHFRPKFQQKFDIFHEKVSMAFGFWSIFGIKFLILKQKHFKNFEKMVIVTKKCYYSNI